MATSTIESDRWSRVGAAVRTLSSMPLIQSGVSLIASSIVTSGLGFVFWIVAARQFSSAQLGIGSAVIAAMILLAELAQLGLRTGLVRFVPTAGSGARKLIARSYGIAAGFALLGAVLFVVGIPLWAPALGELRASPLLISLFVFATACWVLFLLEDSVLVGLRLARWVPVENGLFGLLKILLLFPLASASGDFGIFLAWAVPVFAVVVIVNGFIARRLATESGSAATSVVSMREVLGFSLVDWAASSSRTVVIGVLPLIVLAQLGSSESAYYFLAWTIAFSVYLLSANVGDALVAEASYDEEHVERHTLYSGLLSMGISVPIVLGAAILTPFVLQAFGAEYADGATAALRLLLIGAVPNVITRTFVGKLRAERRMRAVFIYEFSLSIGVLLLGWLLLGPLGIAGFGVAWLVTLTLAALYAVAAESVWWWAPRVDPAQLTDVERRVEPIQRLAMRLPSRQLDNDVRTALNDRYTTRPQWRRVALTPHLQSIAVEGSDGRPPLTIDLALTEWGNEILARRNRAMVELGELEGIASLRPVLPYPIDHDRSGDRHFMLESAISGRPGNLVAIEQPDAVVDAATATLAVLYEASGRWVAFGDEQLERWVSLPLRQLGDALKGATGELAAIESVMCDALRNVAAPSGRLHGNLELENLLFDRYGRLAGVTNWEWSGVGPVIVDRAGLALSSLLVAAGTDTGHVVGDLLDDPERLLAHRALAGTTVPKVDSRVLVLLAWLNQLGPILRATAVRTPSQLWVARNVAPVLERRSMLASITS